MGRTASILTAVVIAVAGVVISPASGAGMASPGKERRLPEPSPSHLPRWRGFNLLEKFHLDWTNGPFVEADFQWIAELGFNFVRLPMDYRTWIVDGDWRTFNEDVLKEIDQAVEWGRKYGIHVCINFHRAPGYTVASPKEAKSLWTDPEALEVCALHWGTFAERYKDIPNRNLSFNLFNEPSGVDAETHNRVVKVVNAAIRKHSPDRLIICDALDFGRTPAASLLPLKVALSTRGYSPFQLTHYKAGWVGDNKSWPVPAWPVYKGIADMLYGTDQPAAGKHKTPLVLRGDFAPQAAELKIHVRVVSGNNVLVVKANGEEVLRKVFAPGAGKGEWKESNYKKEWDVYQNLYDKTYTAKLPAGTKEIVIENVEGDWLTFSEIRISPFPGAKDGVAVLTPTTVGWGKKQGIFTVDVAGHLVSPEKNPSFGREELYAETIQPFKKVQKLGFGVHVGEWGAYQHTPHAVVLRWAEDCLKNWKKAGWGWAMWNFRGSFGVLDSNRNDVEYEDFHGHKLDRQLLVLLQKY